MDLLETLGDRTAKDDDLLARNQRYGDELSAPRLVLAFLLASGAPLLIDMITGIRAIHAPIQFALGWIPFLMVAWCAICITMYAVAFSWTFVQTCQKPRGSQLLSAAAGMALGLATIHAHFHPAWWPLSIIALWTLIVRRAPGPGLTKASFKSRCSPS